jgi:ketosteroid isomerase-like protein
MFKYFRKVDNNRMILGGEILNISRETREILEKYYTGLSNRGDWHSMLSEEILLTGTIAKESRGKEPFINNNFFKMVRGLKVKEMIVENEKACSLVSYDLMSPKGKSFASDVAEIWKVKDGKLDSLAIYFDTAAFQKSME